MQSQIVLMLGALSMLVGGVAGQISCPQLWTEFNGKCYRLFHQAVSFHRAEDECMKFKLVDCDGDVLTTGHLVSIHSVKEQAFLKSLVTSSLPLEMKKKDTWGPQVFIGMVVGKSNNAQTWTDGSRVDYKAWHTGEPNNGPNSRGTIAAGYRSKGYWADAYTSSRFRYICQLPCLKYRMS